MNRHERDHSPADALISRAVLRREDSRFVTGRGRYTDDIYVPGEIHAVFVRSDHAHGELKSIDMAAALQQPGVLAVLTGDDLLRAGVGFIHRLPLKGFDLKRTLDTPRPGLAQGRVRYVGEPVAMVVAETRAQASDAATLIAVDIEALPAVADVERATEKGAPVLWADAPDNIAIQWESSDPASIDAAFAGAAHVTRLRLVNTRIFANPIEPRTSIAQYDAAADRFTWITPSQGVRYMVRVLCDQVFKLPDEQMHVLTYDVGGAFGSKEQPYPEDVAILHAARVLGRPVKWQGTRSENLISDNHARDAVIDCALALDAKGHFLALRADIIASMGAYFGCNGPNGSIRNTPWGLPLVYRTPLTHAQVTAVMTNSAPIGPYRGAGREQASFIVERLVEEAARQMNIDRVSLRRRNLIPAKAIPYKTPSGRLYDSGDFETLMDKALHLADWKGFKARAKASAKRGRIRGQGIANFLECVGGSWHESSHIRFGDDGRIILVVATQSHGQGHETSFPQVVADKLGVPYESIELRQGDSADLPTAGFATVGSRSMIMAGSALANTCDIIIDKGRKAAAAHFEADAADIEFARGTFRVAGTDRAIGLQDLARRVVASPEDLPFASLDSEGDYIAPDMHFPNGCHVCEIEMDPDTGLIAVDRYVAVDDVGTIINPPIVHGQVHGGVAQGLGQVFMEHCQYDEDGQFLTGSFMDYAMPRADNMPYVVTEFHPVPSPKNPLGVKGSGECGVTGSLPALMNAIADALARAGASPEIDMPVTPEKIWRALAAAPRDKTNKIKGGHYEKDVAT
ncbi:MAG TPA: xanthine dehydrogenase family protein molybdopterin-binding subunit [Xanthobacteraceae bacterium]|nr:xanthine dehydrogenase family protein molybdopterin-binding subunit [Xanthobacteraceae bacterium]